MTVTPSGNFPIFFYIVHITHPNTLYSTRFWYAPCYNLYQSLCSLLFMIAHKLCKQANTTSSFCRHFALLSTTWNSSCCNDLWMLLVFMTPSTTGRSVWFPARLDFPEEMAKETFCGCLFFPNRSPECTLFCPSSHPTSLSSSSLRHYAILSIWKVLKLH